MSILCRLFGHTYWKRLDRGWENMPFDNWVEVDYCSRCGEPKKKYKPRTLVIPDDMESWDE
jgi:hypothetical protein